MSRQTKFNIAFFSIVIAVILLLFGGGMLTGYFMGEAQIIEKEVVKYIEAANEERELQLVSLGVFNSSAYDACYECCEKHPTNPAYGKTATGTRATAGRTIAVDPNVIPYGTEVVINGHTYIAEDTGGSIKGKRIDIYFNTHNEALQYGRRQVEVFVLR
jgi:3D (Asp-Asp-Asp) domain-containing protein